MGSDRKARSSRGEGSSFADSSYPGIIILVVAVYALIFVLSLLDVNVDDGAGLLNEYEALKEKMTQLVETARREDETEEKQRISNSVQSYQGDVVAPWENPFEFVAQGSNEVKDMKRESEELKAALEASILTYITTHQDSIQVSPKMQSLLDATDNEERMNKLAKRQKFVEDRFNEVNRLPGSLLTRDYQFRSVLQDPALAQKLTVPDTSNIPKNGGIISNLLTSVFGGKDAPKKQEDQDGSTGSKAASTGDEAVDSHIGGLRSKGTYAAVADKAHPGLKAQSVAMLERALSLTGYSRQNGPNVEGFPLWLISYGRPCPSLKAILSKDVKERSHALFCAAYSPIVSRHVPLATVLALEKPSIQDGVQSPDLTASLAALDTVLHSGGAFPAHKFYRFSDPTDREALKKLSGSGFVIFQRNGDAKPRLTPSISALVENSKYQDPALALVASPLHQDLKLWEGHAFAIRTWVVILRGSPMLAFSVDGDVVVSRMEYSPFPGSTKESPAQTMAMRFPSFEVVQNVTNLSERATVHSLSSLQATLKLSEEEFESKIVRRMRQISTYIAWKLQAEASSKLVSDRVYAVEHLCLDMTVSSDLEVELLATASNCPIEGTSPATQHVLTDSVLAATERVLAQDRRPLNSLSEQGLHLVIDQERGFLFE
mmetsp:Transcript_20581/g.38303  ORF Transcript_20581/g.38303 Transcript_20581/m.38303 type:complete len:659 (-) Transcript_20581:99-2075(-)